MDQTITKKLFRSRTDRIIAGVCGGLGDYFAIDPLIVRLIFLAAVFLHGFGLLVYLILALAVPLEPGPEMPVNSGEKIQEFFSGAKIKTESLVNEMKGDKNLFSNNWFNSRRNLFGLFIVIIGAFMFFNQVFPYHWFRWDYFWPLTIVFIGLLILFKK